MVVLAHDSGWDEILLIALPVAALGLLLLLANRRANAVMAERESDPAERSSSEPDAR